MLVDTHCHLVDARFTDDLEQVIESARADGVEKIVVPGTDYQTSVQAIELAKNYPKVVYAAVGIHPEEVLAPLNPKYKILNSKPSYTKGYGRAQQIEDLKRLITENREWVVAVGEVGTDKNIFASGELRVANYEEMQKQKELFRAQCELALEMDLPVVIHTRDSMEETLAVLDQLPSMPRGHFHCWSDSDESLKSVIERGFYVGFCGNVSYKPNNKLREQVKMVPRERLLLETDSPYLPPIGKRGERNTPSNVKIIAQVVAEACGLTLEELAQASSNNAKRLYKL